MKKVGFFSVVMAVSLSLLAVLSASAAVSVGPCPIGPTPLYDTIPLDFTPVAINNQGVIVGCRDLPDQEGIAPALEIVRWANGQIEVLGTFGNWSAEPLDINDQGIILLAVWPERTSWDADYYLLSLNGNLQKITIEDADARYVSPSGLNNRNQVVGTVSPPEGGKGFIWHPNYQVVIHSGNVYFRGINNVGQAIALIYSESGLGAKPFLWNNGLQPLQLPDIANVNGWPTSINDHTQIVGQYSHPGGAHGLFYPAFWRADGSFMALSNLGYLGTASAINNHGQIVGYLTTDGPLVSQYFNRKAVIWPSPNSRPIFIGGACAYAINDAGQILCSGGYDNYLLQPKRHRR